MLQVTYQVGHVARMACDPQVVNRVLEQGASLGGVLLAWWPPSSQPESTTRYRWRHPRQVGWDERRLEAYIEYARAIKRVYFVSCRLAAGSMPMLTATQSIMALGRPFPRKREGSAPPHGRPFSCSLTRQP